MLETILQKFGRIVLLGIIALLSAVFILQFGGPQSQGCSSDGGNNPAAQVYGRKISKAEYRAAYLMAGGERFPAELAKQQKLDSMVLYGLIERDLLAREAERLGYRVSEDDVMNTVTQDGLIHMSVSVDAGPYLPPSGPQRFDFNDSDGKFSTKNLKNFINFRLRRSIKEFASSQIQENLAQSMRKTVLAGVAVSPQEVWQSYVREKENVVLKYVRFSSVYFGQKLDPSDADLTAYIASHQAEVDAEYEKQKHRYTGLDKQVRARHILIKVDPNAEDEAKAEGRTRAEALLARAKAGEDFAKLASENSEDTGSAKKGGDLGFNPKGRMVKPFDEAQFAMKAGDISELVESTFGLHIIKVEAVREGDVPMDEAKRELAERLYRDGTAGELGQKAAETLLAELKGGQSLDAWEVAQKAALGGNADGTDAPAADPLSPQVRETRPFGRTDTPIPGPFDSSPLVSAAFGLTEEAPLPAEPIKMGNDWFVYRLESHSRADKEGFTDEEQQRILSGLRGRKQREALGNYVRGLMASAQKDNAVLVDETVLDGAGGLTPSS